MSSSRGQLVVTPTGTPRARSAGLRVSQPRARGAGAHATGAGVSRSLAPPGDTILPESLADESIAHDARSVVIVRSLGLDRHTQRGLTAAITVGAPAVAKHTPSVYAAQDLEATTRRMQR